MQDERKVSRNRNTIASRNLEVVNIDVIAFKIAITKISVTLTTEDKVETEVIVSRDDDSLEESLIETEVAPECCCSEMLKKP